MAAQVGKARLPAVHRGSECVGGVSALRTKGSITNMKAPRYKQTSVRISRMERATSPIMPQKIASKAESRSRYTALRLSNCRARATVEESVPISERIRKMFGSVVLAIDEVHQLARSIGSSLEASGQCPSKELLKPRLNPHTETLGLILSVFERSLANSPQLMFHTMITVSDFIFYSACCFKMTESEESSLHEEFSPGIPEKHDQAAMDVKGQFQDLTDLSVSSKQKSLAASSKIVLVEGNNGAESSKGISELVEDNSIYSGEDGPYNVDAPFRLAFGQDGDQPSYDAPADEELVAMNFGYDSGVNTVEEKRQGSGAVEYNDMNTAYAERLDLYYQKKLALDPVQPVVLSNYAQFLASVKQDYDRAELAFLRSIRLDGSDGETLWRYAQFLWNVRSDLKGAESFLKAAVSADPSNPFLTGSYAHFLWHAQEQVVSYDAKAKTVDSAL